MHKYLNFKKIIELLKNFLDVNRIYFWACCLGGVFCGLSAPGFNLWPFAWAGFIPLIVVIGLEKCPKKAFVYSLGFGYFYELIVMSWFAGLHPLTWLGLNDFLAILLIILVLIVLPLYQGFFVAVFGTVVSFIFRLKYGKTLLIPLAWILLIDIVTSLGPFALPWAMIQYSQYKIYTMIQIANIIGGIGVGYIILLFNTSVSLIILILLKKGDIDNKENLKQLKINYISLASIVILIAMINFYGYKRLQTKINPDLKVSVAQSSIPVELFRTGKITAKEQLYMYVFIVREISGGLIVLPEGAIATYLRRDYNTDMMDVLKRLANVTDTVIITGSYDENDQGETNAVIAINPFDQKVKEMPVYHKRHLVPFGEYTPFRKYLPAPLEKLFSISSTRDFARGKKAEVLNTKYGKIGALICYEAIFPSMAKELVRNGAQIIVNVSNLGWFHNSIVDQQFISMCTFRSIENNRYFIVAINNGASAIIDPFGQIVARIPKNKKGYVSAKIKPIRKKTFFTRWGL